MFLKPFRVKTQSSIKGSDRKKLRSELAKAYPSMTTDVISDLIPNKEDMSIMKLETHGGELVTVYTVQKNPIVFQTNNGIFPTVYFLWKYPDAIQTMTTWPQVFKHISKGADLMLPGVIIKGDVTPQNIGKFDKSLPCSVKLLGNKCPVAVGVTAMSSSDMYESAMRGKGVIVMHSYQDFLWAHGEKRHPPQIEDTDMLEAVAKKQKGGQDKTEEGDSEEHELYDTGDNDNEKEDEQESGISPDESGAGVESLSSQAERLDLGSGDHDCGGGEEESSDDMPSDSRTPQERMDELMEFCFKCALKSRVKKHDLPLLTSKFFKASMQPFCPAGVSLDVKKSSYKKLSKFLQQMKKDGYVKIKELQRGVESITEVDRDHLGLRGIQVPEVKEEEPEATSGPVFVPPEIEEMYTLTAAILPFFKELGEPKRKGDAITTTELRQYLTQYVKAKELQNKSEVQLDAILSNLAQCSDSSLRWEALLSRVASRLSPAYRCTVPGQAPVVKKGKLEPISFKIMARAGNKKVTTVDNLELYGIDCAEFAHSVQLGMACSASVVPSPKPPANQVLVQGNQVHFMANLLLEKYKIPRKFLQGLDLAPKSDKRKR